MARDTSFVEEADGVVETKESRRLLVLQGGQTVPASWWKQSEFFKKRMAELTQDRRRLVQHRYCELRSFNATPAILTTLCSLKETEPYQQIKEKVQIDSIKHE